MDLCRQPTNRIGRGWRQLLRYGVVGVAHNVAGYLAFLVLLAAGLGAVPAMTLTYAGSLALSFGLNRQWTFGHGGRMSGALGRFLAAHAAAYALNAGLLHLLVDLHGWPAAWVQPGAMAALAVLLFLLQKYWVFRPEAR